jgi:RNA polymerase sigma-70 factor (ECF subfamily)
MHMRETANSEEQGAVSDLPDHESFMRLWVQHQMRVYTYIRALVFRRADAEDLLQEVAVVLWRKFDQFEPGTRFDQWAYRVARNQFLYYRQKKQRDRLLFNQELVDSIADRMASTHPSSGVYSEALESCLSGLSSDDRELVQKRHEHGATNRSVAKLIGRSESAISRALNRIYLALLQCIRGKMASGSAIGGEG